MPLGRRLEESTAEALHSTRYADVQVHIFPVRYGLARVGPKGGRNRTELMIVDRDVHACEEQHIRCCPQFRLVVVRVNPQLVEVPVNEAEQSAPADAATKVIADRETFVAARAAERWR